MTVQDWELPALFFLAALLAAVIAGRTAWKTFKAFEAEQRGEREGS